MSYYWLTVPINIAQYSGLLGTKVVPYLVDPIVILINRVNTARATSTVPAIIAYYDRYLVV